MVLFPSPHLFNEPPRCCPHLSHFILHTRPFERLVQMQVLIQCVWRGARDAAFLTSFQVMMTESGDDAVSVAGLSVTDTCPGSSGLSRDDETMAEARWITTQVS